MMEVKEFIREVNRMCAYHGGNCYGKEHKTCELASYDCKDLMNMPETAVDIVEKWTKEHPHKTRQSEFLELFPNATLDENGVIRICPNYIDSTVKCYTEVDCKDCCKEYWSKEVE